jgi:hypothetical protein
VDVVERGPDSLAVVGRGDGERVLADLHPARHHRRQLLDGNRASLPEVVKHAPTMLVQQNREDGVGHLRLVARSVAPGHVRVGILRPNGYACRTPWSDRTTSEVFKCVVSV